MMKLWFAPADFNIWNTAFPLLALGSPFSQLGSTIPHHNTPLSCMSLPGGFSPSRPLVRQTRHLTEGCQRQPILDFLPSVYIYGMRLVSLVSSFKTQNVFPSRKK